MATKPTESAAKPRKTTAQKTTTGATRSRRSTASAKPVAATKSKTPEPVVIASTTPVVAEADMKKKELVDLVVARSGVKKKDAKPVVEAMLAVLGEAVAAGREMNLQPFGKLRINRSVEKSNGRVIVCKLRQSKSEPDANEPVAKLSAEG